MNPVVQRYAPPVLVFGAAMYFGWPPAAPLDLGEDVVRANSVRWKPQDLAELPTIDSISDPFQEVLVAEVEETEAAEVAPIVPVGPTPAELKSGLRLDGIADMGGRQWAVLNGRPRLPGDSVYTDDANRHFCKIVTVAPDHIVVRCEQTVTEIRPRPFGSRRAVPVAAPAVPASAAPEAGAIAPPPNSTSPANAPASNNVTPAAPPTA